MGQIGNYKQVIKTVDGDGVLQGAEITERTINYNHTKEEGDFFKIYAANMDVLLGLPETSLKLFLLIAKAASYANLRDDDNFGGQLTNIRKDVRKSWCNKLGISERAYYTHMNNLIEASCIRKIDTYNYQVNPKFVGRGLQSYSPTRGYGGIVELRKRFEAEIIETSTTVEADVEVKELLDEEIERLQAELSKHTAKERRKLEHRISSLEHSKKSLNNDDYTMKIDYPSEAPDEDISEDWTKLGK